MTTKRTSADDFDDLHGTLARVLAQAIKTPAPALDKDGNPVPQDPDPRVLSIARQFLKDNNITGAATKGSALEQLTQSLTGLPFDEKELQHVNPNFTAH